MILAQNILVIGSLVGFVVLAIAWAARPVEVQDEDEDEDCYCTWYTGLNTECGDPATQLRDGFPHCEFHASIHDSLVRLDLVEEEEYYEDGVLDEHGYIHRPGQMPWKGDM